MVELELAEPGTVRDVARALGVPVNLIHAVFVNDRQAAFDTQLALGDTARIFPPVAGGAAKMAALAHSANGPLFW